MRNAIKGFLLALTVTTGACGGGDGSDMPEKATETGTSGATEPETPGQDFIGLWALVSGTETYTCDGQPSTETLSGNVTWTAGTTADLVQSDSNACIIRANVTGETASLTDPSPCTFQGTDSVTGDPLTYSLTLNAYTFVLSADKNTATENVSASLNISDNFNGTSAVCTVTESGGSYQKQ